MEGKSIPQFLNGNFNFFRWFADHEKIIVKINELAMTYKLDKMNAISASLQIFQFLSHERKLFDSLESNNN